MGRHLPHRTRRHTALPILARYQRTLPCHSSRSRTETRTHVFLARRPTRWTPWKRRNDQENKQRILLARSESLDHRIHQRLCDLSTKQKPDPSYQNPTIPHPFRHQRQAVLTHSHGSYHGFTQKRRIRRHLDNSRPWLFTRRNISTLHHHHHGPRHSEALFRKRVPMVRTPP